MNVGLIVVISGYAHQVVALQVGGKRQIPVYEHLTDVEDGFHSGGSFHQSEPCSYPCEEYSRTSHLLNLTWEWFQIQNRREIATADMAMAQEVVCLFHSRTPGAEEVVSSYVIAVFACIVIVFLVERVDDRLSFRTLDVDISDREIHVSIHSLLADGSQVGDAQPLPVDRILLLAFAMLVFGDVDAVDALRCIDQSLALVFISLPFAHSQRFLGGDAESPAVSFAVFPFTLVLGAVVSYPYTIAFGLVQTVV